MVENIVAIIGAITGSVSLGVLIYKTWKEKPRLIFTIEDAYWYIHTPESPTFNIIAIPVRIDNKGDHNTTLHTIHLTFIHNKKPITVSCDYIQSPNVQPHGSVKLYLNFTIKRSEIKLEDSIKNATLKIGHTHGLKEIQLEIINERK